MGFSTYLAHLQLKKELKKERGQAVDDLAILDYFLRYKDQALTNSNDTANLINNLKELKKYLQILKKEDSSFWKNLSSDRVRSLQTNIEKINRITQGLIIRFRKREINPALYHSFIKINKQSNSWKKKLIKNSDFNLRSHDSIQRSAKTYGSIGKKR